MVLVKALQAGVKTTCVPVLPKMLQQFDLSKSTFCQYLLAEDICDLLDGDSFASMCVCGSTDDAICALSQFLCHIVSFINDEVLVEDFEDLAASEIRHVDGANQRYPGRNRGTASDASSSQKLC